MMGYFACSPVTQSLNLIHVKGRKTTTCGKSQEVWILSEGTVCYEFQFNNILRICKCLRFPSISLSFIKQWLLMCMAELQIHLCTIECCSHITKALSFERASRIASPETNDSNAPTWKKRELFFFRDTRGSFKFPNAAGKFSATK